MCQFPGCGGMLGTGLLPSDRARWVHGMLTLRRGQVPEHPEQGWGRQGADGGELPALRTPQPPAAAISQALATPARVR